MTVIADWMGRVVRSESWKRHEDLHLDAVVGERQKGEWGTVAVGLMSEVAAARSEVAATFAVILGFSLQPSSHLLEPRWSSEVAFAADLDESPPSLYMYERDTPEWVDLLSDNVSVKAPPFLATLGDARYRQVWNEENREYHRSLLFVR